MEANMIFIASSISGGLWNVGLYIDAAYQLAAITGNHFLGNRALRLTHAANLGEQEELYRFVGFFLKQADISDPEFADCQRVTIKLPEVVSPATASAAEVKQSLEAKLRYDPSKRYIVTLDHISGVDMPPLLRRLFRLHAEAAPGSVGFDFQDRYWRAKRMYYPEFGPARRRWGKLSVCVHVRRGDVAILRRGDKVLVNRLGGPMRGAVILAARLQKACPTPECFPFFEIGEFRAVLETLRAIHGARKLEVTVCSDGYPEGYFGWVAEHFEALGFKNWDEFRRFLAERECTEFDALEPCARIIGQGLDETKQAIHALATADIVIKGAGGFSRFIVERFRQTPPQLFVDLCVPPEEVTNQLSGYAQDQGLRRWSRRCKGLVKKVARACLPFLAANDARSPAA